MLININKEREIINEFSVDKEIYSTKIISELPSDIDTFVYKYINGILVRDRRINQNYKSQEQINQEQQITNETQDEVNIDFDFRISMLELGM